MNRIATNVPSLERKVRVSPVGGGCFHRDTAPLKDFEVSGAFCTRLLRALDTVFDTLALP